MKDVVNRQQFDGALCDHDRSQLHAGPGLGVWLLPMVLVGSAGWIAAIIIMLR